MDHQSSDACTLNSYCLRGVQLLAGALISLFPLWLPVDVRSVLERPEGIESDRGGSAGIEDHTIPFSSAYASLANFFNMPRCTNKYLIPAVLKPSVKYAAEGAISKPLIVVPDSPARSVQSMYPYPGCGYAI